MWLQITDQPSQFLHDGEILEYGNPIDGQYVLRIKKTTELPIIANLTSPQSKKSTKLHDIKLWHSRMGHLGYKSLTILKILAMECKLTEKSIPSYVGTSNKETKLVS